MYQVWYNKKFSKSLSRLIKGGLKRSVQLDIKYTIEQIALGTKLGAEYRDHQLHGELSQYRECHIQGDLLLIYQIIDKKLLLILINIGSHNDLF